MDISDDCLADERVVLEPAGPSNVALLIEWTLDPVAQGPYKRVPDMTRQELRELFLDSPDGWYFLIRRAADGEPLGRFYYRAYRFDPGSDAVDWELNIFIADPEERGKGYGSAVQKLALDHLLALPGKRSVFATTFASNRAERRALAKVGFREVGCLPHPYYAVKLPPEGSILYVVERPAVTVVNVDIHPLSRQQAEESATWRYDPPYDLYDLQPEHIPLLVDPANRYCAVCDESGQLVGTCCFGAEARVAGGDYLEGEPAVLDVGVSMHPGRVGRGLGTGFVASILEFAQETFAPETLRVTIAEFNRRSQRTFQRLGFAETSRFTRNSDGLVFVQLEREAQAPE